jgi:hypothetical protein
MLAVIAERCNIFIPDIGKRTYSSANPAAPENISLDVVFVLAGNHTGSTSGAPLKVDYHG